MTNGKPVVLQLCLTLDTGGLERVVVNLANELARMNAVESHICSLGNTKGDVIPSCIHADVRWTELGGRTYFTAWNALKLARLVRREGVDLIHAHGTQPLVYALTASLLGHVRVVATKHNSYEDLDFFKRRRVFNKLAERRVSTFTGVADQATEMLQQVFPNAAARCTTLVNGTELQDKQGIRAESPAHRDSFVFATVCRLAPEKDIATLVKAFARVHAVHEKAELWIIGDGAERDMLVQLSAELGIKNNVRFWGFRGRVEQILNGADVYVNSSWTEGISVSILEAMGAGLPIVATAVGGTPTIVKEGQNGLLVAPRNPAALGEALASMLQNAARCVQMGENSRAQVQHHWSLRRMAERYLELYNHALKGEDRVKRSSSQSSLPRSGAIRRT